MDDKQAFKILNSKKGDKEEAINLLQNHGLIKKFPIPFSPQSRDNSFYIYTGPKTGLTNMQEFMRVGATALPLIPKEKLKDYQTAFMNTLRHFPEYKRSSTDRDKTPDGKAISYVAGGFAAFGNPASFHNPFVRNLRIKAYKVVREFLYDYFSSLYREQLDYVDKKLKFEMLFDRMMYRRAGQKGPDEAWHRDVMKTFQIMPEDEIYGGWINIDSKPQYFSFIPGSHLTFISYELQDGFAEIEKALTNYKDDNKKQILTKDEIKDIMKKVSTSKYMIEVPPGHIIIFPQYILHEVVSKPKDYNMMRVFTGWRVTKSSKSIYVAKDETDLLNDIIDNQQVPQLPGGMIPPIYAANHLMYNQSKPFDLGEGVKRTLPEWCQETFVQQALVEKINGTSKTRYIVAHQEMRSLQEYNLQKYQAYSSTERKLYLPTSFDTDLVIEDVKEIQ